MPPPDVPVDEILATSPVVFSDDSREGETTFKADLTLNVPFFQKLQAGGNFKIFGVRYDSAAPLGTDNPFSPVPEQNAFDIDESFTTYQTGAYLQATAPVTSRLSLTVGGRLDHYAYLDSVRVSPRLAGSYGWGTGVASRRLRTLLPAAVPALRVGVPREPGSLAVARRPLRRRRRLGARRRLANDARRV